MPVVDGTAASADAPGRGVWATIAAAVSALGLACYLPLRALQEGFYGTFGTTGADVGLSQAGVLERGAVIGGLVGGLLSLLVVPSVLFGRSRRGTTAQWSPWRRALVPVLVACVPLGMKLLFSVEGTPMPARDLVLLLAVFALLGLSVAAGLFSEDAARLVTRARGRPPFLVGGLALAVLALTSAIGYVVGSSVGEDVHRTHRSSAATAFLLTHPLSEVSITPVTAPAGEAAAGQLPTEGLLLGVANEVALVFAPDGTLWRIPVSAVVLTS